MKLSKIALSLGLAFMTTAALSAVTLDGRTLTQEEAWAAANGEEVRIAPEAMKHLADSHSLVMTAALPGRRNLRPHRGRGPQQGSQAL